MKGDDKVIEYLNKALRSELTAVSQYWLHYRLQEDWGLISMARKSREESIEEMHHADKLIARIIFLEGRPNLQKLDPLRIGQTPKETLEADLAAEHGTGARMRHRRAGMGMEHPVDHFGDPMLGRVDHVLVGRAAFGAFESGLGPGHTMDLTTDGVQSIACSRAG